MSANIIAAMREIAQAGAHKDKKTTDQGNYMYRSAEGILNLVGPILARHGVLAEPVYTLVGVERLQTSGGKAVESATMRLDLTFRDGDTALKVASYGSGRDFSDKAIGKAQTYALKAALTSAFLIPFVGKGMDPDEENIEATPHDPVTGEVRDAFNLPPVPLDTAFLERKCDEYVKAGDKSGFLSWISELTPTAKEYVRRYKAGSGVIKAGNGDPHAA